MTTVKITTVSSEAGDFLEILGSDGNDSLTGGTGFDYINGNAGDDTVFGGAGNDQLYGGKDTDTAQYSGSYSNFTVTPIFNSVGEYAVASYEVKDWSGTEGSDKVELEYLTFNNNQTKILLGTDGVIKIIYNNEPTTITTTYSSGVTSNNGILQGTSASDSMDGGKGNQTLIGGGGNDTLSGGYGYDIAQYSGAYSDYTIKILYENITGALAGYQVEDNTGAEGTDTISSEVEYLSFDSGLSLYLYYYGTFQLINRAPIGSVEITGTNKSGQTLTASNSLEDSDGIGPITYQWQISPDFANWSDFATGSTVTLSTSVIDFYVRVTASYTDMSGKKESFTRSLRESIQSDVRTILGTNGNDNLIGTSGNDLIFGQTGDDLFTGSAGDDSIYGDAGTDTAQYSGVYSNFSVKALYEGKNEAFSGYQVKDNTGTEGTDTIYTDVEYLSFNSGKSIYFLNNGSITPLNNSPTGTVEIAGTTKSGQVLTASHSLADSDGLGAVTYQWQASPDGTAWSDLATGSTVTLSSAVLGLKLRVTASYTDKLGTKESVSSTATDAIELGMNVINGTSAQDNLTGTSAIDLISAGSGNDLITGSTGNDTIDGGAGVDTLSYSGTYASFSIANGTDGVLTFTHSKFGSDSVTDVERFQFTDQYFANDVSGAAGNAAKVITAAFGKAYVPQFLAIGLTLTDAGQSIDALCETVTNDKLVETIAGDSSTNAYVTVIFQNVLDRAPNILELNTYASMINDGSVTRLELLKLASHHSMVSDTVNALNVGLIGIPYAPGI